MGMAGPPPPPPPGQMAQGMGPPQTAIGGYGAPAPPQVGGQMGRGPMAPPPPPPATAAMAAVPAMHGGMAPMMGGQPQGMAPPPQQGRQGGGRLVVYYRGQRSEVNKDRFIIGRGKQSSDLTIKDPNVSRQHAMIECLNGQYFMVDMGSTNGIEYNGMRIDNKRVEEGDVFHICDYEIRFTYR